MNHTKHLSLALAAGLFALPLFSAPAPLPSRMWTSASKSVGAVWDSDVVTGTCTLKIGKPDRMGFAKLSLLVTPFPVTEPYAKFKKTTLKWQVVVPAFSADTRMVAFSHPSGTLRIYPHDNSFSGEFKVGDRTLSVETSYSGEHLAQNTCSFETSDPAALDLYEDRFLDYLWKSAPKIPYCMGLWGGIDFRQKGRVSAKSSISFGTYAKPNCPKGMDPTAYIINDLFHVDESPAPNIRKLKLKYTKSTGKVVGSFYIWADNVLCSAENPDRVKFKSLGNVFYGVALGPNLATGVVISKKLKTSAKGWFIVDR